MTKLWKWLSAALAWFVSLFHARPRLPTAKPEPQVTPLFQAVIVEEQPDVLELGVCYLVGEGEHRWLATFLCPCGCAAEVILNLLPDMRPRWQVDVHDDFTVTLHPSINRQVGCRSHFVIRHGRTIWC